jgi:hypothetical protein
MTERHNGTRGRGIQWIAVDDAYFSVIKLVKVKKGEREKRIQ